MQNTGRRIKPHATMKEYFSHDYCARNDPKLQDVLREHGVAGLGVFWVLIENLYEQGGELLLSSCKSIAFAIHVESNIVESIVLDFNLFQNDGNKFWSNSVNARLNKRIDIAEKRKQAAIKRWQSAQNEQAQSNCNANAMQDYAIKENKRKEKYIYKEESNKEEMAKTAKRFCPPTLEDVQKYISEKGYSIDAEAFIAFYESKGWYVGKNKMKDWRMAVVTWSKRERPASKKGLTTKNCNDEWK